MLGRSGLDTITRDGSRGHDRRDDAGAGARRHAEHRSARARANVADLEIRSQATVGGNLCAGEGDEAPRGDLQGALLALGATRALRRRRRGHRGAARGLPRRSARERLLLERQLRRAGRRRVRRPRPAAHARLHGARGVGRARRRRDDPPRRDRSRLARTAPSTRPRAATPDAALNDVTPHDDALASAWYRTKVLPVLVRRVLTELKESA